MPAFATAQADGHFQLLSRETHLPRIGISSSADTNAFVKGLIQEVRDFRERLARIGQNYQIDTEEERAFLSRHEHLLPILLSAVPNLMEIFGEDVSVSLKLLYFPDESADEAVLFANIQTTLSASEAYPLLERFEDGWWFDASANAKGRLNFTLEYV